MMLLQLFAKVERLHMHQPTWCICVSECVGQLLKLEGEFFSLVDT
jgi:hypothetical protein